MINSVLNLLMIVVTATTMFAAVAAPAAYAADGCMDPRDVTAAITAHQIKSWPAIKAMAGISDQYKEVGVVHVCEKGGQPYYMVNVSGPSGESKQLVLNAVDGSN